MCIQWNLLINKGHLGTQAAVPYWEVAPYWEVCGDFMHFYNVGRLCFKSNISPTTGVQNYLINMIASDEGSAVES